MTSYSEALKKALERIARIQSGCEFEIILLEPHILETETAWYFPYDGREYVQNGNFSAALAGNHPVRVSKSDGEVRLESPPS